MKACERFFHASLTLCFFLHMSGLPALAVGVDELPTGGTIAAGSGEISQSGSAMIVNQYTGQMIANWDTFNIGQNASVQFNQPGSSSVALNRIFDQNPSQIFGSLNANGQIFLLNSAGIIFGPSAQVNVGGLVASSLNISDENFMSGNFSFEGAGAAQIINQGKIMIAEGGYAAFLSPVVRNDGEVIALNGSVLMAAGNKVSLDFSGDGLINYTVDQGAVDALVENNQLIKTDGGLVVMTAKALDELTSAVVNNNGVLEAKGISEQGGRIILDAGENGQTTIAGTMDVSSEESNGGKIVATGERVLTEETAQLLAKGATGGGEIYVGGGWQGSDPDIFNATDVTVSNGALLDASAADNGSGGTIVAWSDVGNFDSVTRAYGTFLSNGGVNGGDGGRIETSGHTVDINGALIAAGAVNGKAGLWLLDPTDVTIDAAAAATIATTLQTTNSTVTTNSGSGAKGDLTVSSAITKASGDTDVTLTLIADNTITVNEAISVSGGTGKLNVVLDADNTSTVGDGAGMILLNAGIATAGGSLSFGTGRTAEINEVSTLVGGDVYVGGYIAEGDNDAITLSTSGGAVNVYGEVILANPDGLTIDTTGATDGNIRFYGLLNSGNTYEGVSSADITWSEALTAAKGLTDGAGDEGDTYLATITSRLENAVAGRVVNYAESWLGGRRKTGIDSNLTWRWVTGPESLLDGEGLEFFL